MKFLSGLKAWLRARTRKPIAEPPTPAVDVVGARITSALATAGAVTADQITAEVRRRHVAFLRANPADVLYAFGMTSGAAHYFTSCDIALNAALLGYPAPDLRAAMLLRH